MKELRNFILISMFLFFGFNITPRIIGLDGTSHQAFSIGNILPGKDKIILGADTNFVPSAFNNRMVLKLFDKDSLYASLVLGDIILNNGDGTKYSYVIPFKYSERSGLQTGNLFVFDKADSTMKKISYLALRDSLSIDSVRYATNLLGGAANKIPYQVSADSTIFIEAPTVSSLLLFSSGVFSWQSTPLPTNLGGTGGTSFSTFRVVITNGSATQQSSSITTGELGYISGLSQNVETVLNDFESRISTLEALGGSSGTLNWTTADGDYTLTATDGRVTALVFTP